MGGVGPLVALVEGKSGVKWASERCSLMAVVSFTEDDLLFASGKWLPDVIANESGEDCDGECCGLRPELLLPADAYDQYIARNGERKAAPHSHLVLSRSVPDARRYSYAILKRA